MTDTTLETIGQLFVLSGESGGGKIERTVCCLLSMRRQNLQRTSTMSGSMALLP